MPIRSHSGISPQITDDVFVAETAAVIGNVVIGAQSSIWYGTVLRGDVNRIEIGARTNIQDGTIVHVNHDRTGDGRGPTTIGDEVTIGHLALIHACTIERRAFIGMRAVVMDNAIVRSLGMVAAGAVVTPGKIVGSGQLWAGMPARYVRDLRDSEIDDIAYLAQHYVDVSATYLGAARAQ